MVGHPPAHEPHCMHSSIFSPPGIFMTSLMKSRLDSLRTPIWVVFASAVGLSFSCDNFLALEVFFYLFTLFLGYGSHFFDPSYEVVKKGQCFFVLRKSCDGRLKS